LALTISCIRPVNVTLADSVPDFWVLPRRRPADSLAGGAAAWPLAARAQQAMPVIGLLDSRSPEALTDRLRLLSGIGPA
jgi:hypothetical protein